LTGCEGYVESAAIGLLAGLFTAAELAGEPLAPPPPETALGALLAHLTGAANPETFQPMNVNFGLFPELPATRKAARKEAFTTRAREKFAQWDPAVPAPEDRLKIPQAVAKTSSFEHRSGAH
jgi:methylenetetrahydrofolate--tRNA-(uracil-5-)-methyltransferase